MAVCSMVSCYLDFCIQRANAADDTCYGRADYQRLMHEAADQNLHGTPCSVQATGHSNLPEVIPGLVDILCGLRLLVVLRGVARKCRCRHLRFRADGIGAHAAAIVVPHIAIVVSHTAIASI